MPNAYLLGFAACTALAGFTFVVLEMARHRSYLKYRSSGFVPSTQHWCLVGTIVAVVFEMAAIIFLTLWALKRA